MIKHTLLLLGAAGLAVATHAQINKGTISLNGTLGYSRSSAETEVSGYPESTSPSLNQTTEGITQNRYSVGLKVGYFIRDNFEIGINGSFSQISSSEPRVLNTVSGASSAPDASLGLTEKSYDNESVTLSWGVGVYATKYFNIGTSNKWFWNLSSGLSFSAGQTTRTEIYVADPGRFFPAISARPARYDVRDLDNNKTYGISLGLSPGLVYFISPKWAAGVQFNNVLAAGYTYTTSKTEEYIIDYSSPATTFPDDLATITSEQRSHSVNAGLNLPSFTSGSLQVSLGYYIR